MKGNILMKKELLLFDLDGTIIDSKDGILEAVQHTLCQYGIREEKESLIGYVGPPMLDALLQFHHFTLEDAQKAVAEYRRYYAAHGMEKNTLFPGIREVMETFLQRGKKLAVATSKPVEVAAPILQSLGLTSFFLLIGGSSLSGERPHKIDVIRYVFEKLEIYDPSCAVMIGDRSYDMEGASLARIDSIGVLYGYGSLDELKKSGANYIAETPTDLLSLIE
ncbi:MAG: HAD hydrolase-like protein [Oscillospiraceae bacterium]|nr:HAD hydrolase-like protein [Oscillospiraceae bacterium]